MPPDHRYYDPLRLPTALLGLLRFSLSSPDTLTCTVSFVFRLRLVVGLGAKPFRRLGLWSAGGPSLPASLEGDSRLSQVPELPL